MTALSPRKGFFLVRGRYALMDPQGDRNGPQLNLIIIIICNKRTRIAGGEVVALYI